MPRASKTEEIAGRTIAVAVMFSDSSRNAGILHHRTAGKPRHQDVKYVKLVRMPRRHLFRGHDLSRVVREEGRRGGQPTPHIVRVNITPYEAAICSRKIWRYYPDVLAYATKYHPTSSVFRQDAFSSRRRAEQHGSASSLARGIISRRGTLRLSRVDDTVRAATMVGGNAQTQQRHHPGFSRCRVQIASHRHQ